MKTLGTIFLLAWMFSVITDNTLNGFTYLLLVASIISFLTAIVRSDEQTEFADPHK